MGEHVAGVELGHESEHGCPGALVAGDQRVLHGRRAAPGGQEREVQVDPPLDRSGEQRLADQPAVGDDHAEIRLQRRDALGRRGVESGGLEDGDAQAGRRLGDGRRRQHAPAPLRRRGTRDDGDDVVRACGEPFERRDGGGRRTGEDEAELLHTPLCPTSVSDVAPLESRSGHLGVVEPHAEHGRAPRRTTRDRTTTFRRRRGSSRRGAHAPPVRRPRSRSARSLARVPPRRPARARARRRRRSRRPRRPHAPRTRARP